MGSCAHAHPCLYGALAGSCADGIPHSGEACEFSIFRAPVARHSLGMPHCTVRYSVRLIPKTPGVMAMDAVGIFHEERAEDEVGLPGELVWRRLETFSGPAGYALKEQVRERLWDVDVCARVGPLEWDG